MTSNQPSADWQAGRYDKLADPHARWAAVILDRLAPAAGETILDAGCGSGRITRLLCERLRRAGGEWSVIGVDGSAAMLAETATALEEFEPAIELIQADLLNFTRDATGAGQPHPPVDAVFSSAVFHWIADHDRLFRNLHSWLRPGGRLQAQCGGEGNVADWSEATEAAMRQPPFASYFSDWPGPWHFAGPEATTRRLAAAGFESISCWLEPRTEAVADGRAYLEVVGLAEHLRRLPAELHESFIDVTLERVADPDTVAYVRLNIEAIRPESENSADPGQEVRN